MAKEILLYQPIYSYTAEAFLTSMEAAKGDDVSVRINCPGGDVMAGMGMLAKYNEHAGGKIVKVDGRAASMAAFFCCMADDVECLEVSEFLFHRAAFPSWVENDKAIFTEELKAMLTRHNDFLRSSIERKIGAEAFKKYTGKSLDEMFSLDRRIDVTVTAKQAEKMGLVSKVNKLNVAKKKEINALASTVGIAALYEESDTAIVETETKPNKMTIADVKANAEVYAAIKAEVLADEKDRVEAFAAFKDIDPAACLNAIVSGEPFKQSFGAKMQVKAMTKQGVENITGASAEAVTTQQTDADKTKEQKDLEAFSAGLQANMKQHFGIA